VNEDAMKTAGFHRPLLATAVIMGALFVVALGGLLFDHRVLVGAPIWLKPLKFAVSIAIYTLTFGWLASLVTRGRRAAWWLGTVIGASLLGEMAIIVGQVVRGRRSHFNVATPLDTALYAVMGVTVVVVWVATACFGVLLLRQRIAERPTAVAARLGLLIALVGLAVGFLMVAPTGQQRDAAEQSVPKVVGAHSVGVPDGGPGLPLVGWSTRGGDLRAGHFVGIHALQALPLFAMALALLARRYHRLRDVRRRSRLVLVAAGGYAGFTVLVTWQALRGQSIVHPDATTVAAGAVLAIAVFVGAAWALGGPPSPSEAQAPRASGTAVTPARLRGP
jgi:hypothetical protein